MHISRSQDKKHPGKELTPYLQTANEMLKEELLFIHEELYRQPAAEAAAAVAVVVSCR